jgi:hypothetical protein
MLQIMAPLTIVIMMIIIVLLYRPQMIELPLAFQSLLLASGSGSPDSPAEVTKIRFFIADASPK